MKTINAIIQLRRDTDVNFDKIKASFIPASGEVVLVDTSNRKLRAKVGDGTTVWENLPYTDEPLIEQINNVVLNGFYLNGNFYTSSTYQTELEKNINKIYIDKNSNVFFYYDGEKFISVNETLPTATDTIAGVMKLYDTGGQNTDGAMTQKAVTDGVQSINFIIDENDDECLVLDLPWD